MKGYIYGLIDPRDEQIKYIGQTIKRVEERLREHIKYVRNNPKVTNKRTTWIRKLDELKLIPKCIILEEVEFDNYFEFDFWESFYIQLFLQWGFELKNGTTGGKSGRFTAKRNPMSDDQKERQRKTLLEGFSSGRIKPKNLGKKMSEEQKKKLSINTSFRRLSEDQIKKRTERNKGKKRSDEQKENLRFGILKKQIKNKEYRVIKAINIKTGEEFCGYMLKDLYLKTGVHTSYICRYLNGTKENKTDFKFCYATLEETVYELSKVGLYLEEFNKEKMENELVGVEKIPFFKRGLSKESIAKRTLSNTGKIRNDEQKDNIKEGIRKKILSEEDYRVIKCTSINDGSINYFGLPKDVAEFIGTHNIPNITSCLKGRIKSTKGFKLSYGTLEETKRYLDSLSGMKFNSYYEVLYTKEQLLDMSIEEREELAVRLYDMVNGFIYPESEKLNMDLLFSIIKNGNKVFNAKKKEFSNSFHLSMGTTFLKSYFKSFYNSSNKGDLSVVKKIEQKINLLNVIKYRIGINNTGEIWDLSFKTIVRGYSAIRGLVSFFKPTVSYSIYDNINGDKGNNCVLDPCCGFGGRMLGYFTLNPRGHYIGCEPNIDTYNELIKLKEELNRYFKFEIKCDIYNMTIEEFVEKKYSEYEDKIDFAFTSIPYYDIEEYSNDIVNLHYKDFNDWADKFIGALKKIKNIWINMPIELKNKLNLHGEEYFLLNNVSRHINKSDTVKRETIIKLN